MAAESALRACTILGCATAAQQPEKKFTLRIASALCRCAHVARRLWSRHTVACADLLTTISLGAKVPADARVRHPRACRGIRAHVHSDLHGGGVSLFSAIHQARTTGATGIGGSARARARLPSGSGVFVHSAVHQARAASATGTRASARAPVPPNSSVSACSGATLRRSGVCRSCCSSGSRVGSRIRVQFRRVGAVEVCGRIRQRGVGLRTVQESHVWDGRVHALVVLGEQTVENWAVKVEIAEASAVPMGRVEKCAVSARHVWRERARFLIATERTVPPLAIPQIVKILQAAGRLSADQSRLPAAKRIASQLMPKS